VRPASGDAVKRATVFHAWHDAPAGDGVSRTPVPAWLRCVREPLVGLDLDGLTAIEGRIRAPLDVFKLLGQRAASEMQEVFYVVLLNSQSGVIGLSEVTRGTLNASLVHPREVFRQAIVSGAAGIILAHNHPSGDPTPSADDRAATRMLVEAGRVLDIPVRDHVVLGAGRFVSFAETGMM
jgi:DNA repair protein RadC